MRQRIVITTSIIADFESSHEDGSVEWNMEFHHKMSPIVGALRQAVAGCSEQFADVKYSEACSFSYPDAESNLYICAQCGCDFTNREQPDQISGLPDGRIVDGRSICDACETTEYHNKNSL